MRKAVYTDKLSVGSAFLVARGIPTSLQAEAWTKLEKFIEDEAMDEDFDDDGRLNKAAMLAFIERGSPRRPSLRCMASRPGPCASG